MLKRQRIRAGSLLMVDQANDRGQPELRSGDSGGMVRAAKIGLEEVDAGA